MSENLIPGEQMPAGRTTRQKLMSWPVLGLFCFVKKFLSLKVELPVGMRLKIISCRKESRRDKS